MSSRRSRSGGTKERRADVRVVAATNKDLEAEQKAGRFREDLYFRLNVITVDLPPLRDRREDIPLLVEHFLRTRQLGKRPLTVCPAARAALERYDWPGNVRELANVLERAQILAEGDTITLDDLPDALGTALPQLAAAGPEGSDVLSVVELEHVRDVLRRCGGIKASAAEALGVSRRTLYNKLESLGLEEA